MRKILVPAILSVACLGAASLLAASSSQAQEYPWCAQYGSRDGGSNCGFTTWRQCMDTVSGVGGYCRENLFYKGSLQRQVTVRPSRPAYSGR